MKDKDNNKMLERVLAFSFSFLFINVLLSVALPNLGINYAILNFIASILPSLFILGSHKKALFKKRDVFILFILFSLQIVTFLLNYSMNDGQSNVSDGINLASYIINLTAVYFIANQEENYEGILNKACKIILLFVAIFCIYNMMINFQNLQELFDSQLASTISFSSFYNNRNNFAELLFLSTIILFYAKRKKIIKTRPFAVLLVLFVINIIATLSRTGIVATLIFITINYAIDGTRQKIKIFFIVLAATLFIFLTGAQTFVNDSIIRNNVGDSGRSEIWEGSIKLIGDKPLFGYGDHGASVKLYEETGNSYAHNIVVGTFLSRGLIYGLTYILFIVFFIKKVVKNVSMDYRNITIASITSIIFYGMFEYFSFFTFGLFNLLFTIIVFVMPVINKKPREIE